MGSLIRATNLWGYDDLVAELGADPALFLERYHIPVAPLRSDDSFLLYRSTALLLEATAVELDCPDFGLRLAKWQGLEILGAIAVIARNSNTVLDALDVISKYLYIHSPALALRLEEPKDSSNIRFSYSITELSLPQLRQSYELSMANGLQILTMLAGTEARPCSVAFLHEQLGPLESYEECFGCEIHFERQWCGMELAKTQSLAAIDHADPKTLHYATKYLETKLAPGAADLSLRVRELIRRLLPIGQCNANNIAAQLAMHPRTLQRKLDQENLQYERLLDLERRELAEGYLAESRFQMVQIAGLLGYTEQSSFSRACKRWFGYTPRKYQKSLSSRHS